LLVQQLLHRFTSRMPPAGSHVWASIIHLRGIPADRPPVLRWPAQTAVCIVGDRPVRSRATPRARTATGAKPKTAALNGASQYGETRCAGVTGGDLRSPPVQRPGLNAPAQPASIGVRVPLRSQPRPPVRSTLTLFQDDQLERDLPTAPAVRDRLGRHRSGSRAPIERARERPIPGATIQREPLTGEGRRRSPRLGPTHALLAADLVVTRSSAPLIWTRGQHLPGCHHGCPGAGRVQRWLLAAP
jgi:hypothetical protein